MSIKFIVLPPVVELLVYLDYFQATNLQARSTKKLKYIITKYWNEFFYFLKCLPECKQHIM